MLDVGGYMKALEVPALVLSHALFRLSGEEGVLYRQVAFHVSQWSLLCGAFQPHTLVSSVELMEFSQAAVKSPLPWLSNSHYVCVISLTPSQPLGALSQHALHHSDSWLWCLCRSLPSQSCNTSGYVSFRGLS